jgi:hypothetical protein
MGLLISTTSKQLPRPIHVVKFIEERYTITGDEKDYVICRDLWGYYFEFCKKNGLHPKPENIFGKELPDEIVRHKKRVNGEFENCYFGIRRKEEVRLAEEAAKRG